MMKKVKISLFVFLSAIFLLTAAWIFHRYHPLEFRASLTEENPSVLANPFCGFYQMYGYTLSDEGSEPLRNWCDAILSHNDSSLVLLEINLRNYSGGAISDDALAQLEELLDTFASRNLTLILRFLYDWDGRAPETEPSSRTIIQTHMEQIAPYVNRHAASILTLQSIFTGDCGEMHHTRYGSREDISALLETLSREIDPQIFLSVRTPAQLRSFTGSCSPLPEENAFSGTPISRLGLFNDGMMGSVSDLGTYDDTPLSSAADPSEKGTREEELAFQNQLCRYVPNGGEVVIDNYCNDLTNAIRDLSFLHVSYLNAGHDTAVLDKWKHTVYEGKDGFSGQSGYDYIAAHLGYRYLLTDAAITFDPFGDSTARLTLSMTNTGFAPSYRKYESTVTLTGDSLSQPLVFPMEWDNRFLCGSDTQKIMVSLPVRDLEPGTYSLSFSMSNPDLDLPIQLANRTEASDGSVLIGSFTLE